MNARTLSLLAVLAAPAALAQVHLAVPVGGGVQAVVGGAPCGAPPVHHQPGGRWELRTTQHYVPGVAQQVWVDGQCTGNPRKPWKQRCTPGRWVTTETAGRYETRQDWVWVAFADRADGLRHGRHVPLHVEFGFR